MPSPADREKALETALAQIDRQFGKGSVMRLGSDERAPVAIIPTGSIALDVALGIGGLPRGRIVEIYGPESSGKTTLTLHAIANAQRAGGIAAFIDAEHALDPEYAKKLGVDIDSLLVSQPDTGEQALEIADMLVRSGSIDLIVIDSVAALVPKAEIEGEMGDSHVGLQARLMSQALRKLTGGLSQTSTTMIFINQLREKIGVFFGSPETTAGGKALKFYASVRLDIRRIETLKDGTDAVGNRTRVKVVKNKMAPPFKQAEFDILYGIGISREGSLIDYGVEHEIVRKSGAWYTYDGDQLGQGKENARNFLHREPDDRRRDREEDPGQARHRRRGQGGGGGCGRPPPRRCARSKPSAASRSTAGRGATSSRCPSRQASSRSWSGPPTATATPGAGHVPAGCAADRHAADGPRTRAAADDAVDARADDCRARRPSTRDEAPAERGCRARDERDRDAELARAENVSMHALTRRGQSRRELERTLRSRDLADDVIAHEVERLERVGLIDDIALARTWSACCKSARGSGAPASRPSSPAGCSSPAAIEYALELVDTGDELGAGARTRRQTSRPAASYDRATAERGSPASSRDGATRGSTVRAAVEHALPDRHAVNGVRFR